MKMEEIPYCERVGAKSIHSRWTRRKRLLVRRIGMYDCESSRDVIMGNDMADC